MYTFRLCYFFKPNFRLRYRDETLKCVRTRKYKHQLLI